MSQTESTAYNAATVESKWYAAWESAGLFSPDPDPSKPVYCITIPPPNITGSLHMGHALNHSVQDLLARFKRMTGHSVLILPGQDHAGIATQSVVAKQLKKEGHNPQQLGREKFIERVWAWRKESGDTILNQFRALGCSYDWSRLRFTLDEKYAEAVLKVFIDWFDRGLIYKGLRVVNWDPVLKTSVSDIETERQLIKGKLYHVRYPFTDGSGEVIIATTRPETMLGDVAVAVHPKDPRYTGLIGKTLRLPLVGREIPLIADEYPDPEFGTGAVKITPGHDANDFEVGQRHDLPILIILDETARVSAEGPYLGMDRRAAREQIVKDLEEGNHLVKIEDHEIAIIVSQRSQEVIEPLASEQWFVNQRALAQPAIQVVENGQIEFFPERFRDVYLDWLRNIRDWCISRQLWWGHRVPVFYTADGRPIAALSAEEAAQKAGEPVVRQDDDVLDTWFSSGLWPFATLGWPDDTDDLKRYYPTQTLTTARDIMYLWVARMVMMGMDFVKDIPFQKVYIHATVLTQDGKRMSKSLGTGVDPMDVINERGADALRYTLLSQAGSNQEIRYGEQRTLDARNFANKIWNASRFVMMNLDGAWPERPNHLEDIDEWLLGRLVECEAAVKDLYEGFDFQAALGHLYRFFWSDMCDWYIEISKSRLQDPAQRQAPQWVLATCLDAFLKMMHPAMPFITEEIYSLLPKPGRQAFLDQEAWPDLSGFRSQDEINQKVDGWLDLIRAIRALRAEAGVGPMKSLPTLFIEGDLRGGEDVIRTQSWFAAVQAGKPTDGPFVSGTLSGVDFHIPLAGLVDPAQEVQRLQKEEEKLSAELLKLDQRLGNPQFTERAKPEVIERDRAAAEDLRDRIAKLKSRRAAFEAP